jgi:hypothetical protein
MPINVSINGSTFAIPTDGDLGWGDPATDAIVELANTTLQKNGGNFTLTNDVNFGSSFGLIVKYLKSITADIALAGFIRMAKGDLIGWRNEANNGDVYLNKKTASDTIAQFANIDLVNVSSSQTLNGKNFGDTASLDASAVFQVTSTTKGSIPAPKMTTAQRNAIASPTAGLQIFNTDTGYTETYDGSSWNSLSQIVGSTIYLYEVFA